MNVETVQSRIDGVRRGFREAILDGGPPAAAARWRLSRFERGLRLADEIEARIGDLAGKRVLDVGTGFGGDITALYARGASCVGADLLDHQYASLKRRIAPDDERLQFVRLDCTTGWPLASGSFDVVVTMALLEIVQDLDLFFSELLRVLAVDGLAVVYTGTALRMARRDPLFKLPLVSLLPTPARRWIAERVFGRRYRFAISRHSFYSASHIARYVAKHGFEALPTKYATSRVMARIARWPFAGLWQALIRYLAFDFVIIVPRDRSPA